MGRIIQAEERIPSSSSSKKVKSPLTMGTTLKWAVANIAGEDANGDGRVTLEIELVDIQQGISIILEQGWSWVSGDTLRSVYVAPNLDIRGTQFALQSSIRNLTGNAFKGRLVHFEEPIIGFVQQ